MKIEKHPEMTKSETAARYHDRCAEYHARRQLALAAKQNYRDAAHHGDISAIHHNLARFLEKPSLTPQAEMSQDDRDDTVLGR